MRTYRDRSAWLFSLLFIPWLVVAQPATAAGAVFEAGVHGHVDSIGITLAAGTNAAQAARGRAGARRRRDCRRRSLTPARAC